MPFAPFALTTALISLALGIGLTFAILYLASRLPWLARASSNRLHVAPTPVWGGVAIFISFMATASIKGVFNNSQLRNAAIAGCGMFLVGLADDIWKLRPRWKLLGQIVCALVPISFVFTHPFTGNQAVDVSVAALWMIGITNAFNLLDNINGLSAGTAVLVSSLQAAFFLNQSEPIRALGCITLGSAVLGFLFFNFPNGRIFMGDSGSLFIGFWLATTALTGTQFSGRNRLGAMLFPLLVMVVPICDTTLVTLTRMLKGRPVSVGGTDHLSHRLIAYGFGRKSTVLALWAFTLLSGMLGFLAVFYGLPPLLSAVAFLIVAVALFLTYLTRYELHAQTATPLTTIARPRVAGWIRVSSRVLFDLVLVITAYYTAYLLRFDGDTARSDMYLLTSTIVEVALIKLGVFVAFGAYRPWWDYFGLKDAYRLIAASGLASLTAVAYFSVVYRFYGFSRIVFALDFLVFTMLALVFRFSFRLLDEIAPANHRTNVFIYGANSEGETVLQFVSKHYRFRVVGFLDDDQGKRDFSIRSVPIRGGAQDLARLAEQWQTGALLLTPSTPEETKMKLLALCNGAGIKLLRLNLAIEEIVTPSQSVSPAVVSNRNLVGTQAAAVDRDGVVQSSFTLDVPS